MNIKTREKISKTLKGTTPWNKGLKMSKEFNEHCRQGHIGLKLSEKHKKNISLSNKGLNTGSKNGMYGNKYIHSKFINCPICSKQLKSRGLGAHLLGHTQPPNWVEAKKKISESVYQQWEELYSSGRKIKRSRKYTKDWTEILKEYIRNKYLRKCLDCGIDEKKCKKKLHVHHVDWNKLNCSEENLIPLCTSCHMRRHRLKGGK